MQEGLSKLIMLLKGSLKINIQYYLLPFLNIFCPAGAWLPAGALRELSRRAPGRLQL